MVNAKNVTFKVDKQALLTGEGPQAFATVINCRKPSGKRPRKRGNEVKSHQVHLSKFIGTDNQNPGNKRKGDDESAAENGAHPPKKVALSAADIVSSPATASSTMPSTPTKIPLLTIKPQHKPTRFRTSKTFIKGLPLDCWFTILSFSAPSQLLETRTKIADFYHFLRDNPMLWKHSRDNYYANQLPEPPTGLTEFQYAHLRHGQGCMGCGAKSTRKTYWAFLRRWCKTCLNSKTIKENDTIALLKGPNGEDLSILLQCLPAANFDSWGNYVGVGPSGTHTVRHHYVRKDVEKLLTDFFQASRENHVTWHAEMRPWIVDRVKQVEERRNFARLMELWEDSSRQNKSFDYHAKKMARKMYFREKASQLDPPVTPREMENCGSYRRAVAIPKEPNMTSWLQLKPKLEKEAADFRVKEELLKRPNAQHMLNISALSETSKPSTNYY